MAWQPLPDVVEVTLKTPEPKAFILDPQKTAVVVVDMENYFIKNGNERCYDVIEGNERLLEMARASGAKVIHVHSVRHPESPNQTLFKRHLNLLIGTWNTGIVDELTPKAGDVVVDKWSHDVWAWWGMEAALEREGIIAGEWTILVTGVGACTCAHAAAIGFSNRHYKTLIPLDATASSIEREAITYHQYMGGGYNHNMDFTLSTMVTFERAPALAAAREPAVTV